MTLKEKTKTYSFWISLVSAVLIIVRIVCQRFNLVVNESYIMDIVTGICGILVLLGILSSPTKKGESMEDINEQIFTDISDTNDQIKKDIQEKTMSIEEQLAFLQNKNKEQTFSQMEHADCILAKEEVLETSENLAESENLQNNKETDENLVKFEQISENIEEIQEDAETFCVTTNNQNPEQNILENFTKEEDFAVSEEVLEDSETETLEAFSENLSEVTNPCAEEKIEAAKPCAEEKIESDKPCAEEKAGAGKDAELSSKVDVDSLSTAELKQLLTSILNRLG